MVFSSLLFIAYFLPITLLAYYLLPKHRNVVLIVTSLLFYAFGEPIYIVLLIGSSVVDYLVSKILSKTEVQKKRIMLLLISLVMNIGLLSFFKYADFLIESINSLFNTDINTLNLPLPIGISFYTFQTLSYTIDVYRKRVEANKSFKDFLMYISMFPQLIAGPIVRYADVEPQLKTRVVNLENIEKGSTRFILGLAKKVLIADQMGALSTALLASEESILGFWVMVIAYGLQIFFDFSAYSDMAIGLGKMLGFDFLENFNYPYIADSVSEFWRRWHMSLGNWFRDYVYFPLGGSRVNSKLRLVMNLFVVWLLTGFWHGASWNYVLWGLYFGLFIVIEKLFLQNILARIPKIFRHIYLLLVVIFGWVLFWFEDLSKGVHVFTSMLGFTDVQFNHLSVGFYLKDYLVFFVLAILFSTPLLKKLYDKIPNVVKQIAYILLFIYVIAAISDTNFSPFIYFRF